jgi:hypothetical protein
VPNWLVRMESHRRSWRAARTVDGVSALRRGRTMERLASADHRSHGVRVPDIQRVGGRTAGNARCDPQRTDDERFHQPTHKRYLQSRGTDHHSKNFHEHSQVNRQFFRPSQRLLQWNANGSNVGRVSSSGLVTKMLRMKRSTPCSLLQER